MDKRIKTIDREKDRADREALYQDLALGRISVGEAVKRMRKLSKLTQPEFAKHRGISTAALRQIESDAGNPTIETLNKVVQVFGLHVGFVPNAVKAPT
ncbi:helix-turn-helix transcriptional regulator [Aquabacterium sp.]|uniref:helix-turn-helix domain-containing protein n=1 Tax=Aquabacterium sp. TaxID=1872578 RepID=UPI00199EA0F7|nr:helix-turn-helix transcriptional regulator [Aquabacterium sp.]MBC7701793.1 helix-turn-helix transcriptional regulator [Aquabacterium sp.]